MLKRLLLVVLSLIVVTAQAQFTPGQILTAAQLNGAFSNVLPVSGGTLTGPLGFASTGAATSTTTALQYLQGSTGSVARSVTNKFQESVSVTDFMIPSLIADTQSGSPTLDSGPSINAAINYVAAQGGGIVRIPAGTYGDSTTIFQKTGVTLRGDGKGATTIRALASSTVPVLQTYQFASLTGTNTIGGPYHWGIVDLSIDGNKAGRSAGSVDNVDIYGYDYILENIESFNAPGTNLYSEWAVSGTVPVSSGGNSMEAHIHNVKTMYGGAYGLVFNGPHDSVIDGFETYENSGGGALFGNTTNYTGGATYLTNFHSYSNWSNWGLIVYCQLYVSNVQSEGNTGGGIQVNTGSGVLVGQNVVTWGNIGPGLWLNGSESLLSSVTSHNNTSGTGDGISITQPGQSLSNVTSFLNAGNGITGSSAASSSSITNVNNYSNTGAGVSWAGAASTLTNLVLDGNAGGGLVTPSGLSGSVISGSLANNTGVQAAFGTLGASNLIDMSFYTGTAGQTAWSGTLTAANQIRLNATGQDTRQYATGPTVSATDNSTQLATTAMVNSAITSGALAGSFSGLGATSATVSGATNVSYSNPILAINDTSGTGQSGISFTSGGTLRWQIFGQSPTAGSWGLDRFVGGSFVDIPLSVSNSTGIVTMPDGLVLQGTTIKPNLSGTTGTIGGSALAAGACSSGTVAVTGATTSMSVVASPATYPGDGNFWEGYVSAAGTVTVKVCASIAATPTASAYNVRVLQ
jgi:hypothetical protein